jgi:hypothetical protein
MIKVLLNMTYFYIQKVDFTANGLFREVPTGILTFQSALFMKLFHFS